MDERPFPLWKSIVIGAISLALFLGLWQMAISLGWVRKVNLAPLPDIWKAAVRHDFLLADILVSTKRVAVGFALSILIATPIGLVMGVNRWVRAVLNPMLSIIRPLPSMSWIPLSIAWLGIEEEQKYAIVFMGCFASVLVYTIEATLSVDPNLRRAARNLGASRTQEIFHVVLPAALPQLLSGLKVIMAIAWTCVISAEMVGATRGLGFQILSGKEVGGTAIIYFGMLCISVTVLLLDIAFRGLEWALLPWQRGKR